MVTFIITDPFFYARGIFVFFIAFFYQRRVLLPVAVFLHKVFENFYLFFYVFVEYFVIVR